MQQPCAPSWARGCQGCSVTWNPSSARDSSSADSSLSPRWRSRPTLSTTTTWATGIDRAVRLTRTSPACSRSLDRQGARGGAPGRRLMGLDASFVMTLGLAARIARCSGSATSRALPGFRAGCWATTTSSACSSRRGSRSAAARWSAAPPAAAPDRILCAEGAGLSLEEIAKVIENDVSAAQLRGMLLVRRSDAERAVAAEAERLRLIETPHREIDAEGALDDADVVLRSEPARRLLLSVRRVLPSFAAAPRLDSRALCETVPRRAPRDPGARPVHRGRPCAGIRGKRLDVELDSSLAARRGIAAEAGGWRNARAARASCRRAHGDLRARCFAGAGPFWSPGASAGSSRANGYRLAGPGREGVRAAAAARADTRVRGGRCSSPSKKPNGAGTPPPLRRTRRASRSAGSVRNPHFSEPRAGDPGSQRARAPAGSSRPRCRP